MTTHREITESVAKIWREIGQPSVDGCVLVACMGSIYEECEFILGMPVKIVVAHSTHGHSLMLAHDDWRIAVAFDNAALCILPELEEKLKETYS